MLRLSKFILLSIAAIILAACGNTTSEQQTLVAYNATLEAGVIGLQGTATAQIERLLVTVERAETMVARATEEQSLMLSTLQARDVDTSVLPAGSTQPPTVESAEAVPGAIAVATTPPPQAITDADVTPFATASPPPAAQQSGLSNIVLASSVGADDCATNTSTQFTTTTPEIYIVATANFDQQTQVTTRWLRDGEQLAEFSFTYGIVNNACIWFFAEQTDFEFTPGSYSVVMQVDGVVLPAVPFTISN